MIDLVRTSPHYRGLDSFKLLIPLEKADTYYRLSALVQKVVLSTGELIGAAKPEPYTHSQLGCDTHYGVMKLFGNTFLYILVNSKLLKANYFTSINAHTMDDVYNEIMSQNVVSIAYDDFCNAKLTDVDIKTDFDMYDEDFYQFCSVRKKSLIYPKFFSHRPNLGIEYVKRHSATPSNPYVKYYSKHAELFGRSNKFREAYLPNFYNENLRRCEVTIRNHDHRNYIGRKLFELPTTLKEWCSLSQSEYRKIIIHCVEQHENHVEIQRTTSSVRNEYALNRSDYHFYKIYLELKKHDYTDDQILNLYDQRPEKTNSNHYNEKSSIKKRMIRIREVAHKNYKPLIQKRFL